VKRWVFEQFEIGYPFPRLGSGSWSILDSYGHSEGQSCDPISICPSLYSGGISNEDSLATRTLAVPIHASQDILLSVRILARMKVQMAATAVKTALQVPWVETAFKAIEVLIIPDPATMIHATAQPMQKAK
jgi:hypothetical protein